MVFGAVLVLAFFIGIFIFGLHGLRKLTKTWKYQAVIKTWIFGLLAEVVLLLNSDEHYVPLLGLSVRNGIYYILALTFDLNNTLVDLVHGQQLDIALLLLLPLLPSSLVFWYVKRRYAKLRTC